LLFTLSSTERRHSVKRHDQLGSVGDAAGVSSGRRTSHHAAAAPTIASADTARKVMD
jgi:hypothetical protein